MESRESRPAQVDDIECVDAHFHIWELQRFSYPWPTSAEVALYRDFTVEDLKSAMKDTPVHHAVFVQVLNNSPEEADWLSELAQRHDVIKGIVAGVDVTDPNLQRRLDGLCGREGSRVVGVRHILDMESEDWLTRGEVIAGLRVLQDRGLPFDLLLRPHLLKYVPRLSAELPRLRMVVDHIAKPYIKDGRMEDWASDMKQIASNPNIYCKISGMVTEANLDNWKEEQFEPYVKHILEIFGPERCMFGSDWPVCQMAGASYSDVFRIALRLVRKLAPGSEMDIFRENAVKFYGLKL